MKNNTKYFSFKTLSAQFLMNYFLLFAILVIIGGSLFTISGLILYSHYQLDTISFDIVDIHSQLKNQTPTEVLVHSNLPSGSYIEIIDPNLTVISEAHSIHKKGYQYDIENFSRILINYYPEYSFYYPDEESNILLVVTPEFDQGNRILKGLFTAFITIILCLFTVVIIYSKLTSKKLLRPINTLLEGVESLSSGNYNTRLSFESKNELNKLRDAFNNMAQKIQDEIILREKSEANRKKLIMDISHDLKTPLTNILGYTETLIYNEDLDNVLNEKYLTIIQSNSIRANNLINNLFDFSKLEIDTKETILEKIDICEYTRHIIISYIAELEANNMSYDFEIPDKELICLINVQLFERAISNLIINSIKHSGKSTRVSISIKSNNNFAQLNIQDDGRGISTEFADTLFEPFFRADESRNSKTGGTGLGLAISKAIIEKFNGTIILDQTVELGCKFIIELPLA